MTSARDRILERVRAAVASRPRTAHPGPLTARDAVAGAQTGGVSPRDETGGRPVDSLCVQRFIEQFRANGGEAVQFETTAAARGWLDVFAAPFDGVAASDRVPAALRPAVLALAPETAPLGISMAAGAAAETGTLLLDSREGRRLQLLPPVHLIWILESDIERTLGAALARFRADSAEAGLPAAIGLHSAPSKSADIGRILVVGVHGPGRVIAAIIPRGANP